MAIRNKTAFYRLPAFQVLALQMAVTLVLAAAFFFPAGATTAGSILIGGALVVIPQAYFAAKTFRYYGARSAQAIVRSIWSGHAGKMILTSVLFALTFAGIKSLDVAALAVSYIAVMVLGISAQFLTKSF